MRLFLDANILFSAVYQEGRTARTLRLLSAAPGWELLTSHYAVEEARRNLALKAPDRAGDLMPWVRACTLVAEPNAEQVERALTELSDPDDAPILAAARIGGADVLVTGDVKHFGHLFNDPARKPRVMRLADAVALVVRG